MLLRNLLSVAAVAATVYAGPCRPRSSLASSETASSIALSSFTSIETLSTVLTTDTTTAPETTALATETAETSTESESTTDDYLTTITETQSASTTTGTTETSAITVTAATTLESTTEIPTTTEILTTTKATTTAESSTIAESSTTTTSVFVPLPTFGLVVRGISNPGHQFDGYTAASPTTSSDYIKLYSPGSAPANWPTAFHIDENTGRLINGNGQAFCAQTVIFNSLQDPTTLYPCNANTVESSGTFAERVLKCTQSSAGELECTMTGFSDPFRYFRAYDDGYLGIGTTNEHADRIAYISLRIVEP